jgi:hypothetical protein
MYVMYYASMLRYWHLKWILVRTDHPCLGVGCHTSTPRQSESSGRRVGQPRERRRPLTGERRSPGGERVTVESSHDGALTHDPHAKP